MNKNYMKMELELFLSKMNGSSVPLGSLFKLNSVQFKFQNISGTAGTKFTLKRVPSGTELQFIFDRKSSSSIFI